MRIGANCSPNQISEESGTRVVKPAHVREQRRGEREVSDNGAPRHNLRTTGKGTGMEARISASAAAFDAIASRYDDMFSAAANPLIAMMRARVFRAVDRHFPAPATLLEIGCGTGEDALSLTARGHRVVACDPAPAMIAAARAKLAAAGRSRRRRALRGTVEEIADAWPARGQAVDGVFSNFAPLNCELSLAPLRLLLDARCAAEGRFIAVVLPRICPLEVALFMARADRAPPCAGFAATRSPTSRGSASR